MEPMSDASSFERTLMQNAWDKKMPLNGSIELLPLCNMDCDMCYVRLSKSEMEAKGKIKTAEEWLSLGEEMQKAGVMFMLLTGGEPLLHPEFKEIYLGLQKLGMILTLNTNGTLIDEVWVEFFVKHPPRRINITLYGTSRETYQKLCHFADGYDRTMNAIRMLNENHIDLRLGMSVTNHNKHELESFFELRKRLKIFAIADCYMVSAVREREKEFAYDVRCNPEEAARLGVYAVREIIGEDNYPEYLEREIFEIDHIVEGTEPGGVICYAGNCSFAISWLGDMHPCVTMTTPSANVFEVGFEAAWKDIVEEVKQIRTSSKCQKCNLRPICKNCAGNALVETGSYDKVPDYVCRYAKETERLLRKEHRCQG